VTLLWLLARERREERFWHLSSSNIVAQLEQLVEQHEGREKKREYVGHPKVKS